MGGDVLRALSRPAVEQAVLVMLQRKSLLLRVAFKKVALKLPPLKQKQPPQLRHQQKPSRKRNPLK